MKHSSICIIGVPEGKKKEQEVGNLFEKIMKENFPNLMKEMTCNFRKHRESQTRRMQRGLLQELNYLSIIFKLPLIIVKLPKVKDKKRILKAAIENKLVTYRGVPKRPSADFSEETLQARRD